MRILQIANYKENGGGISVQVRLLRDFLLNDGYDCTIFSTQGSVIKRMSAVFVLFFEGRRYDVFHIHACSHRGFLPAVLGIRIGRLLGKRIILTYHGGDAEAFFSKRQKLVKYYLNKTSANIVLSGFLGQVFDKFGLQYSVIPNVIKMDNTSIRSRVKIRPRFISVRSLTETYNIKCTLKAFQMVLEKYPDASLVLVGEGPQKSELMHYVQDHHLNNVTFVGQVPNTEISRYLDLADIMVTSSRFDNMPVSILEGFRSGLLVVASNVGGVPYMIEDGYNGLLFVSDDYRQMAEKMITAIAFPNATLGMIENAYRSLDAYTWESCREKLLSLYLS